MTATLGPDLMSFIRNAWYPAAWSADVAAEPLARTFLGEEVVLYRASAGQPVALANACPHRFAALAKGKLHGDSIACPYHGLQFGTDGRCTHNPHGPATGAMRVRSYPLCERNGMIWIWMGDPARAPTPVETYWIARGYIARRCLHPLRSMRRQSGKCLWDPPGTDA